MEADQGLQLRDVDIIRGSNVQIWFVKLGVIYEVAGSQGSEAWLTDVLKTCQFTIGPTPAVALLVRNDLIGRQLPCERAIRAGSFLLAGDGP